MNNGILLKLKILLMVFTFSLITNQLIAQTNNGIFFQAVARDNYSNPAKGRKIYVQATIIKTSPTGNKELIEEFQTNTDATGMFNISIGNGTRVGGTASSLSAIDWSNDAFFLNLKIAITPISITFDAQWDYTKMWIDMGTTSFGVVPYALYSANSGGVNQKLNSSDTAKMLAPYAKLALILDAGYINAQLKSKVALADSTTKYVTPTMLEAIKLENTALSNQLSLKANNSDLISLTNTVNSNTSSITTVTNRFNALSTVAFSGNYNDLINKPPSQSNPAGTNTPANAGTLTGNKLNPTVTESSLTSVGPLTDLTVINQIDGSISGNAGTATKLVRERSINGVGFDGSQDITVTADAETLSGTKLNPTVTESSLTSVGTLTDLTVINQIQGSISGNAETATTLANKPKINFIEFDGYHDINIKIAGSELQGTSINPIITRAIGLSEVGTIKTGVWNGTAITIAKGGTGTTTAAGALTNLGAEPTVNKSTATDLGNTNASDVLFPSQKAVKSYVDAKTAAGVSDGSITNAKLAGSITASKLVGTDITTVGTITSGTWGASVIGNNFGGAGTVNGLLKADGYGIVSAAVAGTDYLVPTGSAAGLTNFPIFNQNTTGNALTATTANNITATSNTTLTSLSNLATVGTITSGTISISTNIKTSGTITAGTITFPNAHGISGQVLSTSGSGALIWSSFVPYTGATGAVDLGAYDLKVNGLTIGTGAGTISTTNNTAAGYNVLAKNSTGLNNSAFGYNVLGNNTSGSYNSAFGINSLSLNTVGSYNSAFGRSALRNNTSGINNSALGYQSLFSNTTGDNNTALGFNSLFTNNGDRNTSIGNASLYYNSTGYENTSIGNIALSNNSTGNQNTAIGHNALITNSTGNQNTAIGSDANVSSTNLTNATAIGYGAIVSGSNTIQLGNTDVTNIKTSGTVTAGTITYPNAHGISGQMLSTTGSGTLTWTTFYHTIGESYGGGIVFYVYDNGQHGLIAAINEIGSKGPQDWTSVEGIIYGSDISTGAFRNGIGAGYLNTDIMISKESATGSEYFDYAKDATTMPTAANFAQQYTSYTNGNVQNTAFGDWYLPSILELATLYANQSLITGSGYNSAHRYWSSTEANASNAYILMQDGTTNLRLKSNKYFVLPIRRF